jgi:hypothetical protein
VRKNRSVPNPVMSAKLKEAGLFLFAHGEDIYKSTAAKMLDLDEDAFYGLYPQLEEYHNEILEELNTNGYVDQTTLAGRRREGITNRNEAMVSTMDALVNAEGTPVSITVDGGITNVLTKD